MRVKEEMAMDGEDFSVESKIETESHVEILGCRVSRITLVAAVELIEKCIGKPHGRPCHIVATGFHGIWEAYKNPNLRQVLNSADLFCPDGIAPVWLSRLCGEPIWERVTGPDLMSAFLARADVKGYSSFFLGDTQETLLRLKDKVGAEYPGHRIAGVLSPPFRELTPEEDRMLIDEINETMPDVLWIGLGTPKQEWWIHKHKERLRVPVVAGVGAAFRFLSGNVRRAPQWIGESGFEWLWRLAMEPKKLWRRDFVDGPQFVAHALLDAMSRAGRQKYQPALRPGLSRTAYLKFAPNRKPPGETTYRAVSKEVPRHPTSRYPK